MIDLSKKTYRNILQAQLDRVPIRFWLWQTMLL